MDQPSGYDPMYFLIQTIDTNTIKAKRESTTQRKGGEDKEAAKNQHTHTTYSIKRLLRLPRVSGMAPLSWFLERSLSW